MKSNRLEESTGLITKSAEVSKSSKAQVRKPKNKSPKSTPTKQGVITHVTSITLDDFVNSLVTSARKNLKLENLNLETQKPGSILLSCFNDSDYKPTSLDGIQKLSNESLIKIVKVSKNYKLLILIFINFRGSQAGNLALARILKEPGQVSGLLSALEAESKKPYFGELLQQLAENVLSNAIEYRDVRWWILLNLKDSEYKKIHNWAIWATYNGKSEEFFALPTAVKAPILRKLVKSEQFLLEFLHKLEIEKSSKNNLATLKKATEKISIQTLVAFCFSKEKVIPRPFLEILGESLRNGFDASMNLEDCLPYLALESYYPGFLGGDRIKRAWKRVQRKDGGLIEEFKSDEVNRLTNELEQLSDELYSKTINLQNTNSQFQSAQREIDRLKTAMSALEDRLRERVSGQNSEQTSIERQIRIDQFRLVIESLDSVITNDVSSALISALERIGIRRIGIPGEEIEWNGIVCDSITGNDILTPVVIKSGYSWTHNDNMSVLVQALVKPKS